jgi:hypothetical protein
MERSSSHGKIVRSAGYVAVELTKLLKAGARRESAWEVPLAVVTIAREAQMRPRVRIPAR